jgi:Family of unknown function (DUF5675)
VQIVVNRDVITDEYMSSVIWVDNVQLFYGMERSPRIQGSNITVPIAGVYPLWLMHLKKHGCWCPVFASDESVNLHSIHPGCKVDDIGAGMLVGTHRSNGSLIGADNAYQRLITRMKECIPGLHVSIAFVDAYAPEMQPREEVSA